MTDLTERETNSGLTQLTAYDRLMMGKQTDDTRKAYKYGLKDFGDFVGKEMDTMPNDPYAWLELDTALIASYIEHLKNVISSRTDRPLSTATISRNITSVKELLKEATYQGLYPADRLKYILERLPTPKVTNDHHSGVTLDEQETILNVAMQQPGLKGLRDYAIFRLWLETGIRRAELAGLKVRDIEVKESTPNIVVRKGKGNNLRTIAIQNYTFHILREWLTESGQGDNDNNPIFCQVRKFGRGPEAIYKVVDSDKHLKSKAFNKLVGWYIKQAGIESKVTPHSFRVALVTDSLDGGAPIQHVQRVTGHTTTRMITDVYDRNQYNAPVSNYRKKDLPKFGYV